MRALVPGCTAKTAETQQQLGAPRKTTAVHVKRRQPERRQPTVPNGGTTIRQFDENEWL